MRARYLRLARLQRLGPDLLGDGRFMLDRGTGGPSPCRDLVGPTRLPREIHGLDRGDHEVGVIPALVERFGALGDIPGVEAASREGPGPPACEFGRILRPWG